MEVWSIMYLFENYGEKDYIGEPVTQKEHMVQAAMNAEKNNESVEIIIACLLHDIGHLLIFNGNTQPMGNLGVMNHESEGANFLRKLGYPEIIPTLVESHVKTKKYLARNKDYYDKLSEASKQTLVYQGGVMSDEEAKEYENHPNFKDFLKIRKYDEQAKVPNLEIKSLDYYESMITDYLNSQ